MLEKFANNFLGFLCRRDEQEKDDYDEDDWEEYDSLSAVLLRPPNYLRTFDESKLRFSYAI